MKTNKSVNSFDTWSYVHCFGSFVLASILWKTGIPFPFLIAFGLGLFWECIDALYCYFDYGAKSENMQKIWDNRGFSWLDLLLDAIGIAGAFWVLIL